MVDAKFEHLANIVVAIPTTGLEGMGSPSLRTLWSFGMSQRGGVAHALEVKAEFILETFLSPWVSPTLKMFKKLTAWRFKSVWIL